MQRMELENYLRYFEVILIYIHFSISQWIRNFTRNLTIQSCIYVLETFVLLFLPIYWETFVLLFELIIVIFDGIFQVRANLQLSFRSGFSTKKSIMMFVSHHCRCYVLQWHIIHSDITSILRCNTKHTRFYLSYGLFFWSRAKH